MVYPQNNFEKIYKLYYPKMVAFAKNYVSANEDVENIVQDVFLVLWEKKDDLNYLVHLLPIYLLWSKTDVWISYGINLSKRNIIRRWKKN